MSDRRRYPRVEADVLCRPAGIGLFHHRRNTQDISLGGMRIWSDQRVAVGSRLELEVFLGDAGVLQCWAKVVWAQELDPAAPARWEIGLMFTDMDPGDVQRLASVLVPAV